MSKQLKAQIQELQDSLDKANKTIKNKTKEVSELSKEVTELKREAEKHINTIGDLKEVARQKEEKLKAHLDMFLGIDPSEETKEKIVKEMVDFPDTYKKILTNLINNIKMEILIKAAQVTDNVGHIKFMNGSLSALNILKRDITATMNHTKDNRGVVTRQKVEG